MAYAELHCLSNFTFLRGASHPEELVVRAQELGYAALAITDECSFAGVVRAHVEAKQQRMPLIIGSELRLEDDLRLVLLAGDRAGYGNLAALITRGRRNAIKGSYRLTRADLADGVAGCLALWLPGRVPDGDQARWLAARFPGALWIAAERLLEADDALRCEQLAALGTATGLPLVAAGDVHMHRRERRALQDTLTAIRLKTSVAQVGYALHPNGERHLRPLSTLQRLYPATWLAQTLVIAQRCRFSLDELRYEYPEEIVPAGQTPTSYLRQLTEAGFARRFPAATTPAAALAKVRKLIEHELALIAEARYEAFFLTVYDVVEFARGQGILCQGRGSAANSAVCYCLGITAVDPSRMEMLFERFISRERNEPPDIDVDFEHQRREEVIQYLYRKYTRERAALTATVICYRPRSALRDVGKALGLDLAQVDRLAKSMAWWDGSRALTQRVTEAGFDAQSPVLQRLFALVTELLGFPRHLSQHTGGFVISRGPLSELVPVENAAMPERTVIEWDKDDLDALGLLKVDVLALGMLSAIRRAFDLLSARYGRPFALTDVPAEDRGVYEMIGHGDTVGVFQIESRAQMAMLPRLKPANYYDLVIEVAIVRPGPIQGGMVHPYLRRRQQLEPVTYPSAAVRGVLERTLGVPIFQEQVMQLAVVAADFTPGESDQLRRSMAAWKRKGGLEPFERRLVDGMRRNGYDEQFARQIYQQILGFGEYGFPECVVGETRVVDADTGQWVTIDEILSGRVAFKNTLACDGELRLQKQRVIAVRASGTKPVWRLQTASDHTITATAEHPFLTLQGWRKLGELREGDHVAAARSLPMRRLADSDVCWDRIVRIEAAGYQPTYDLQIEGHHNFLANNLVVHNSHAASFALLVYVSAWIKCYEPAVFTCALLNSQPMGFYSPSQLTQDLRRHGGVILPADATLSEWECTLEALPSAPALRLGLCLVKGLSQAAGERLVAARRVRPFASVDDLARRGRLNAHDMQALAAAGALASLSGHRRDALWGVAGVERMPALLDAAPITDVAPVLVAPSEGEDIVADYASLGLTLGRHPLALLRERLQRQRMVTAAELKALPHGRLTRVTGLVTGRQRPGTASGVTFVTLEDETGMVNVIVWRDLAERQRKELLRSSLLTVYGTLEREGEVVHLIAGRLRDQTSLLGNLLTRSRDFH
jgi:DNA-directed DNA polymerase III PolC